MLVNVANTIFLNGIIYFQNTAEMLTWTLKSSSLGKAMKQSNTVIWLMISHYSL